jgi:tetrahydromethanopterin S-methyltransferase subunit F
LGAIGVGLMVGVRSAPGTALGIAVGALFAFVLTMPRRTDSHEPG